MPAAVPFIPAIAGVAGSLIGARSASKAAKQQGKAQQAAIDTQNQFLGPYAQAGQAGIAGVQDFVDSGSDVNFRDTQAYKDITNTARSGGQRYSGNRDTALGNYLMTNFRPQRLNELMSLVGTGANAAAGLASNIGGLQQNIGTAQAQGTNAQGQNYANILGTLGGINFSSLLNKNNLSGYGQGNYGGGTYGGGNINQTFNPGFDRSLFGG